MDRWGWASQVVDLVNLEEEWLNDVVSYELKSRVPKMMDQIVLTTREEIINDDHAIPSLDQTVHEVWPDEARPARDHDPLPLPLQTQRNLPPRIPGLNPEPTLVVDRAVAQVARLELGGERV